ncbi:MAG TPA: aspartate aminotransferase family protein [Terriglobales bacterium]|jgi:acetylornithine aminotransferase/acetylornithine/N-succinyldiaminopimelate aminotransferase|nr:aspartate aminotransferase family protein [Terriglobales bacterium]
MSLASVSKSEDKLLLHTYDRHKILFEKGRGLYLWDSEGNRYLDFLSGIGVNALGHGHPAIRKTLQKQADKLIHVSNLFFHEYQAELAKKLTKISGLDRAFFCNSGTEAWEGALKLARAYARSKNNNGHKAKWRLLALENSFHGRTFGSLATTGQEKYRQPFAPMMPGVGFVAFNDVEDLKRQFDGSVCAICLETIQGEGGIRPLSPEFLQTARDLTKRTGALLILDEIQCGLGRTGKYFAYQHYEIKPDVITVAKPLAAGLPLGAILTTNEVASGFHPGMHGTTFGGGPLACSVAIEFLNQLDGLLSHVKQLGGYFHTKLEGLKSRHSSVREVRGMGLMLGLELDKGDTAKAVVAHLLKQEILINRTHETVLRFLPPYIIQKKHVDQVVRALDAALTNATPATVARKSTKRSTSR